jgi:creatinine amidohydrolase/Fe(II)-dependent formamide hydrolase-like protein
MGKIIFGVIMILFLDVILSMNSIIAEEKPKVVTPEDAKIIFSELLPHELMKRIEDKPIAVIPIGAIEYHGPQCASHVDISQAEIPCWKAVEKAGGVCINSVYWGGRGGHALFPTSLLVRSSVVRDLLIDIIENLRRHGFRAVLGVTGHMAGGHVQALNEVMEKYKDDPHMEVAIHPMGKLVAKHKLMKKYNLGRGVWDHGGANETSNIMASAAHRADLSMLPAAENDLSFIGLEGLDPHLASAKYGRRVLDAAAEAIAIEMAHLLTKGLSKPLPERKPASITVRFKSKHARRRYVRGDTKNMLLLIHNGIEKKIPLDKEKTVYDIDGLWSGQWGILTWSMSVIDGHKHGLGGLYKEVRLEPGKNDLEF